MKQSSVWSQKLTVYLSIVIASISVMSMLVVLLTFLLWRTLTRGSQRMQDVLRSQQDHLLSLLSREGRRSDALTNLLMSRDPMTYSTLMSQTPSLESKSLSHDGLVPTGTDAAEYLQVAPLYGEKVSDDVTTEFREWLTDQ